MADQVHEEMKGTGEKIADAMTNMATHPVQTAAGIAIAPFEASAHLGMFASQELRKKQGTWKGDDVVSPRDAGFAAAQLLAMGATEAAMPALEGFFGKTMAKNVVEAVQKGEAPQKVMARMVAARAATHTAIGAGVGALWTPDDPAVGAFIGGLFGGVHALSQKAHVTMREGPSPSQRTVCCPSGRRRRPPRPVTSNVSPCRSPQRTSHRSPSR
jgi:hypothetical protein